VVSFLAIVPIGLCKIIVFDVFMSPLLVDLYMVVNISAINCLENSSAK